MPAKSKNIPTSAEFEKLLKESPLIKELQSDVDAARQLAENLARQLETL